MGVDDPTDRRLRQSPEIREEFVGLAQTASGVDDEQAVGAHDNPHGEVERRVPPGETARPNLRPTGRLDIHVHSIAFPHRAHQAALAVDWHSKSASARS
ncbi:hypothetical protein GCM10023317_66190 [Actinopolymorpha pittospori]